MKQTLNSLAKAGLKKGTFGISLLMLAMPLALEAQFVIAIDGAVNNAAQNANAEASEKDMQVQQAPQNPKSPLDKMIPYFSQDDQPIPRVMQALGRSNGISIICDPNIDGKVYVEFYNISLRGALDAICDPYGFYWELEPNGWVSIRRTKTIIYHVEYPRLERTGTATSEINLGNVGYSNNNNNMNGGSSGGSSRGSGSGGGGSGNNEEDEDKASVKVEQKNDDPFWTKLETELKSVLIDDKTEKITFNRFSGTVQVTAGRKTHQYVTDYLGSINMRIGMQVEIVAKIVEVQLDDQHKLGIDWRQAATSIGGKNGLQIGQPELSPSTGEIMGDVIGNTNIMKFGSFEFSPDTFSGTIGLGDISAMIYALSQQGTVNTISSPRIVTTNNQTAYIKDTNDKPFFQLQQSAEYRNYDNNNGTDSTYRSYQINTISIGTIMAVTPQVANNGDITLDVMPALTRLKDTATSPDKLSNAPDLQVKQASTIVRLRSGETAVIGGLITDAEGVMTRGVPFLEDIPFIGKYLFQSEATYHTKSELVIFLTPRIIKPGSLIDIDEETKRNAVRNHTVTPVKAPSMPTGISDIRGANGEYHDGYRYDGNVYNQVSSDGSNYNQGNYRGSNTDEITDEGLGGDDPRRTKLKPVENVSLF